MSLKLRSERLRTAALAILLASGIWLFMVDRVTSSTTITIHLTHSPKENLQVEIVPKKLTVEIRGPNQKVENTALRDPTVYVYPDEGTDWTTGGDFIQVVKRDLLERARLRLEPGVQIVSHHPDRLLVKTTRIIIRDVQVKVPPTPGLAKLKEKGFKVVPQVTPDRIRVSGPEGLLKDLTFLTPEPVSIGDLNSTQVLNLTLPSEVEGVEIQTFGVQVSLHVNLIPLKPKEFTGVKLHIEAPADYPYWVVVDKNDEELKKVSVLSTDGDPDSLRKEQIRAFIQPPQPPNPDMEPDILKVQVRVPPGFRLLDRQPKEIYVRFRAKNAKDDGSNNGQ